MRGSRVKQPLSQRGDACQHHVRKRRGGQEIIMDCDDCGGRASLEEAACFGAAVRAVQDEGMPVSVTLRSHMETMYGGSTVRVLSSAAMLLDRLDMLEHHMGTRRGRDPGCGDCLDGLDAAVGAVRVRLLAMDIDGAMLAAGRVGGHAFPGRGRCRECADMLTPHIRAVADAASGLRQEILAGGLGIVEVD